MPSVSFKTQFRISRFAVESGADGVDRVRLAVENNAKVFVLHMENMRNNKLKTKTRLSDIIEPKAAIWDPRSDLSVVVLRRAATDPSPTCCLRSSPTWGTG